MIFLQFFNIYFPFSFPYRIRYHRFPKQQLFKQGRGIPAALRPPGRPYPPQSGKSHYACSVMTDKGRPVLQSDRPYCNLHRFLCQLPSGRLFQTGPAPGSTGKVSITFRGGHGDCRRGPVSPREDQDRGGRNDRRRQSGGRWVCEDPAF